MDLSQIEFEDTYINIILTLSDQSKIEYPPTVYDVNIAHTDNLTLHYINYFSKHVCNANIMFIILPLVCQGQIAINMMDSGEFRGKSDSFVS